MPKEALSRNLPPPPPQRGPNGRFTSGMRDIRPGNDNEPEILDSDLEEVEDVEEVEAELVEPKKSSPPKIPQAALRAAAERQSVAKAKDQSIAKGLKNKIDAYDPMDPAWVAALDAADPQRAAAKHANRLRREVEALDPMDPRRIDYTQNPMNPVRVAAMDAADPQGAAERRAARLKREVEALDPMDPRRIDYAQNPMNPVRVAAMDAAQPERATEKRRRNFERAVEKLDPMDPRRTRTMKRMPAELPDQNETRGNPKRDFKALLAENKILERINALKSAYAARYGADLDKASRGQETIGESFRAWRRDIRPMQGLRALLRGALGPLLKEESLETTLKNARSAKETKEYYINEYDQAQTELAQSRNARGLGKQPEVSQMYYEEE